MPATMRWSTCPAHLFLSPAFESVADFNHRSVWLMASATPDLRLPTHLRSITALPLVYQIILLGDRDGCETRTRDLSSQYDALPQVHSALFVN